MPMNSHIVSLVEKHKSLEQAIINEAHRPVPDSLKLRTLKREKLRLKDEISRSSH